MAQLTRTARGNMVDFELLAIKQQLASAPVPRVVEQRKQAIDEKDGVKAVMLPLADPGFMAFAQQAASESATQGAQLASK